MLAKPLVLISVVLFPPLFNALPWWEGAGAVLSDRGALSAGLLCERLPSGATVIVKEAKWAPVAVVDFWFDAGSRHDPPGRWGAAHFLEHLLMRGGDGKGGVNFSIESLGGEANAATSRDFVHFYALVPSANFKRALSIMAEALANLRADQKSVEAVREVILREMKAVYEDPLRFALEAAFEAAYKSHPYGHPVEGTPRSLSLITPEVLQRLHRERYVAGNLCLVVVGDVDAEEALSTAREVLKVFPSDSPPQKPPTSVEWPQKPQRVSFRLPVNRARVLMALPAPSVSEFDDVCAIDLALVLLSKGDMARLRRALVDQGLADEVGADFLTRRDPGLFCVYAVCAPERAEEVERRMAFEVGRLGREGPSEEELRAAKGLLSGMFLMDIEGMVGMAGNLGFYETLASHELALSYIGRLMALEPDEVAAVARRYLDPQRAVVVEVLPQKERGGQR